MLPYIGRRLLATIPVMAVVAVVVFSLLRLTAGDPAAIIAGDNATSADVEAIRAHLGLDRPLVEQFVIWLGRILRGDFGESFFFKKQVSQLILDRVEPTLALATTTLLLTIAVSIPIGVLAARAKGLGELPVLLRHVLRNAAVPIVTVIGIGVAVLIGGVVVTESVYGIPGLGRLTVDAVQARDYPTVQAVILLFSVAYVLINL